MMQESIQEVLGTSFLGTLHSYLSDTLWYLETQYPTSVGTWHISGKRIK